MESACYSSCVCDNISWMWYILAVLVSFIFGWLWYGMIFTKKWLKAVNYDCPCGADIKNGEECTCKNNSFLPMIMQVISTAFIAFMYFILTSISVWLSLIVLVAVCAWMKTTLKFQIPQWKRFVTLAAIDVGYFAIVSAICIIFASL